MSAVQPDSNTMNRSFSPASTEPDDINQHDNKGPTQEKTEIPSRSPEDTPIPRLHNPNVGFTPHVTPSGVFVSSHWIELDRLEKAIGYYHAQTRQSLLRCIKANERSQSELVVWVHRLKQKESTKPQWPSENDSKVHLTSAAEIQQGTLEMYQERLTKIRKLTPGNSSEKRKRQEKEELPQTYGYKESADGIKHEEDGERAVNKRGAGDDKVHDNKRVRKHRKG